MLQVFEKIIQSDHDLRALEKKTHILTQVGGPRDFEIFDKNQKQWIVA